MNTSSDIKLEKPKIIQALLSGFNTIASKPYLILLPVILDLFLWLGPAWRVDEFFRPFLQGLAGLPGLDSPEYAGLLESYQTLWQDVLENFNLAITLRTLPIGVPSLMVSKSPFLNPLGRPPIFSLDTNLQVFGFWALFLMVGFFFGNVYFQNISRQVIETENKDDLKSLFRSFLQIILMPVLLLIILVILSIPVMFLITLMTLISPGISQFIMMIVGVVVMWILMPLIFTPHGVFLFKQNLIAAMITSISVVRVSMGKTAWFLLVSFVLLEGMDYLWRTPAVDNWFLIVGILGHAFIVSAVIASSFHYFIDATKFTQTLMNNKLKSNKEAPL